MTAQAFPIDLNKPLAFQVGHLGEDYDEWVHQPILSKGSPRLFANEFIEWFTRTPWWVVPLFWLPVSWGFILKNEVPGNHVAATVVAGVMSWTLIEYCLHRFLLHIKTTGYWGNTFHYLLHGCHHKHPMDDLRLVLPPPLAAIFVFTFWNLTKLLIPAPYWCALFGGEIFGYVVYDCIHYFLHYGKTMKPGVFHQLKRYHMNHHFGIEGKGFGVTTAFWDWMFGTLPSNSEAKSLQIG